MERGVKNKRVDLSPLVANLLFLIIMSFYSSPPSSPPSVEASR